MTDDRDLLTAVFAQHLGYAPAEALLAAGAEWATRRAAGATLRAVLLERGVLSEAQAHLVDGLIAEAQRPGPEAATLQSLAPGPADSLEAPEHVADEDPARYSLDTGPQGRPVELGRGGTGLVLVARDHALGRDVAMKQLRPELTTDAALDTQSAGALEARFLREARISSQLEHPAVVPVYELGRRADGTLYYTMRRVRGRTLAQALRDARTLEGRLAFLPDLVQVARALASAHHRGVVHRDLKPHNIMLGPFGETYLMDWGLARVIGRKEGTRSFEMSPDLTAGRNVSAVGTPSYMSPEQAYGSAAELDERTDVWGLGAVLYELLTGRAPFVGDTPWEVVVQVRSQQVVPVRALAPEAPPELAAICEKALQRPPERRYQSAAAMAEDLEASLEGERVAAYDSSLREVLRRVVSRHRVLTACAALTLVGVLAAVGWTAWDARVERDESRRFARLFLDEVSQRLTAVPGSGQLVERLMASSLEVYGQSVDVERGPREERVRLGLAWNRLGRLTWQLGRPQAAADAFTRAQRLGEALHREAPEWGEGLGVLVWARVGLTDLAIDRGQDQALLEELAALAALGDRAAAASPASDEVRYAQALAWSRLTSLRSSTGDFAGAEASARHGVEVMEAWHRASPGHADAAARLSLELGALGQLEARLGQLDAADLSYQRALQRARELVALGDTGANRAALAEALYGRAQFLSTHLRPGAAAALEEARAVLARSVDAEPQEKPDRLELVLTLLLLDRPEAAWETAQPLADQGLEAEYAEGLVAAAFASGHDQQLRARLATISATGHAAALLYNAVVEALAGNLSRGASLAGAAAAEPALPNVLFLREAVARRARGKSGPGPDAVRQLLEDVAQGARGQRFGAAVEALSARLTEAGGPPK